MTISKTIEPVEIICSTQKRKRWTPFEKQKIVQETYHPGVTVSYIARDLPRDFQTKLIKR